MATKDIGFALNYTNLYQIDVTPDADTPTWARLGQGISSVEPNDKDKTSEDYYYDGGGDPETDVVGGSHGYKIKGDRYYGNKAQDFIADMRFLSGDDRVTNFRHIEPDGKTITGKASVTDITANGGDANSKGGFECSISFKGSPTVDDPNTDIAPEAVTAQAVSVKIGAKGNITPTVTPTGANDECAYASDKVGIATVDDNGVVTGVAAGTCTISIKCIAKPTVKTTCTVTVTAA